jgi:DNA-binding MarR family transcriptional regulator
MTELKYLNFADILDQVREDFDINPSEWRALRVISKPFLQGSPIKTIDLMRISTIASPATIHKIIKILVAKELIQIKQDKVDGRIKYLVPTVKTLKIFKGLSKNM